MNSEEIFYRQVEAEWKQILDSFAQKAVFHHNQVLVIGCSTSEVMGIRIGQKSSTKIAETLMPNLLQWCQALEIYPAVQCCEHLNRVLIVERECQMKYNLEEVTVLPSLTAGGAMALQAWKSFKEPVAVERIRAHAGIDIGNTFIGMHLREVVVPVRIENDMLGKAHVALAVTRPKYVGGPRAAYPI